MKKVIIEPGCITCGLCEFIAPDVFSVTDVSRVKPSIDYEQHAQSIEQAVQLCPVRVITCKELSSKQELVNE
jgi:ferredoxin